MWINDDDDDDDDDDIQHENILFHIMVDRTLNSAKK
jgi:hypothetical protein